MTSFWNAAMACRPVIQWLEVDGISVRVVTAGEDGGTAAEPPVILIHGASGHLESYLRTLPVLAGSRRVVAYDLPWHGYSGYPGRPYDVFDYAHHLALLVDKLGLQAVSLVGQSLGAAIAARVVVEGLLPVRKLILIGAAGAPTYESAAGTPRSMLSDLSAPSYDVVKRRLEYAMVSRGPEMDELIECRFLAYQLGDWDDRVRAFSYHEEPSVRVRTVLSEAEWQRIGIPTLLVWGAEDRIVPPSAGAALACLVPGATLRVFPRCGHNPQFERPDEVNPVLDSFLAGPH